MDRQLDLTGGPIPKLLLKMALPASIGFFFNTMYNFVDTFFAGQISTAALAALSLSFPVFIIVLAIGAGIASGTTALVANSLGAGNEERACRYQAQAISFSLIVTVVITIPMLFVLTPLFRLFQAEGETLARAVRYTSIILIGGVLFVTNNIGNAGLSARGDTRTYRNFLIVGFALNVGLDPLLLYGLNIGGVQIIPRLEEAGIAIATVLIQGIGSAYILWRAKRSGSFRGMKAVDFRPRAEFVREIASQGLPSALNMMAIALGTFVITYFVSRYGSESVAAYGAAIRIEQIALIPTIGLNIALATLVGQNNGAGKLDRVRQSFFSSLKYGIIIMVGVLTPVVIFGRPLIGIFTNNAAVIDVGVNYLYIQVITFFSYVVMNQANSVLQGLKKPAMIMYVALYRQVAAAIPVFYLLTSVAGLGVSGVWWGLVIVNWTAAAVTYIHAMRMLGAAERRAEGCVDVPDAALRGPGCPDVLSAR